MNGIAMQCRALTTTHVEAQCREEKVSEEGRRGTALGGSPAITLGPVRIAI